MVNQATNDIDSGKDMELGDEEVCDSLATRHSWCFPCIKASSVGQSARKGLTLAFW